MSIELSLSDELSEFVDRRTAECGFAQAEDYIRDLIQRDLKRQHVDQLLHDGINSGPGTLLSDEWWANKRESLTRDALDHSA